MRGERLRLLKNSTARMRAAISFVRFAASSRFERQSESADDREHEGVHTHHADDDDGAGDDHNPYHPSRTVGASPMRQVWIS
jgi:hypothetical protein